ncbi:MAG TPA: hypothetical protein VHH52_03790 [Pseudonocardiaceae bacterium]|nr:hypothetical protein [Pseudonocardiaceae bacterium]
MLKNDVIVGPVNANLHQYDLAAAAFQPQPDGVKTVITLDGGLS